MEVLLMGLLALVVLLLVADGASAEQRNQRDEQRARDIAAALEVLRQNEDRGGSWTPMAAVLVLALTVGAAVLVLAQL